MAVPSRPFCCNAHGGAGLNERAESTLEDRAARASALDTREGFRERLRAPEMDTASRSSTVRVIHWGCCTLAAARRSW